jgi:TfoX/Sxy family transcriptional regulator of competence genes
MATSIEYVNYVISCLDDKYQPTLKKMFGEYMIYINQKPILLVCDNTVFVKMIPELKSILENCEKGYPYESAKIHYIIDFEDKELTNKVIDILELNVKGKTN